MKSLKQLLYRQLLFLEVLGRYISLMGRVCSEFPRGKILWRSILREAYVLGFNSIPLIGLISAFTGGIIALQTAYNLGMPLLPKFLIGYMTRESVLLEFSSTVICLILAGKIGSQIVSEVATMRVTQQIDALEVMGVNAASFLLFPKIVGIVLMSPILFVFSLALGMYGGYVAVLFLGEDYPLTYIEGLRYAFKPFYIFYGLSKILVFTFIISSVSSYFGYTMKGGALEVGKASTKAVEVCSMLILLFDLLITQLLLT